MLRGDCKTKKGKVQEAALNLAYCLSNEDGVLETGGNGYQKTSRNCRLKDFKMTCEVMKKDGFYVDSTVDLDHLITNLNGVLDFEKCEKSTSSETIYIPGDKGGYTKTCFFLTLTGSTLSGMCLDGKGVSKDTSLDLATGISNNNAVLTFPGANYTEMERSKNCKLLKQSTLSCELANNNGWFLSELLLDDIISNKNGELKFNNSDAYVKTEVSPEDKAMGRTRMKSIYRTDTLKYDKDYLKSCKDIKLVDQSILKAQCVDQYGNFRDTELDLDTWISGTRGQLKTGGPGYKSNSKNCTLSNNFYLTCDVNLYKKVYLPSSLILKGVVYNDNTGRLQFNK